MKSGALTVIALTGALAGPACSGQTDSSGELQDQVALEAPGSGPEEAAPAEPPAAAATQLVTAPRTWSFDDVSSGSIPPGWKLEQTNPRGGGARWSVEAVPAAPSGGQVLVLTDPQGASGSTYNLAWTDEAQFQNGRIEVKVRAGAGREDMGGGPTWRVQDQNNYYIARWNPLENNYRLYFVQGGRRAELASVDTELSPAAWHTIAIEHSGNQIAGFIDGERVFETTDDTFAGAGGVGAWTKADAATLFDDLSIDPDS